MHLNFAKTTAGLGLIFRIQHITQHDLFLAVAEGYTQTFAKQFVPENGSVKFLDLSLEEEGGAVLLDLVCTYQVNNNPPIALLFRPKVLRKRTYAKPDCCGVL